MITTIMTDETGSLQAVDIASQCPEWIPGLPVIQINEQEQRQSVLGFGIALTDASCYLINTMPEGLRRRFLEDIFAPHGLGLSLARVSVGASDYATELFHYASQPDDFDLCHFSIDHDRKYVLPTLLEVQSINPDIFLFASTWSPPGWMKTGGSMCGGWLRKEYLEVYARYYLKFLLAYAQEGVSIQALTPQNEPETDQAGKMPASLLHPDFEAAIVRDYLRPLLQQQGLNTQIWILDHNFSMWNRARWMLDDPAVKAAVDGVAFHYYDGTADLLALLHAAHPEVGLHWTEGGPDLGPHYADDWCKWGQVFSEAFQYGCSSLTGWNLLLDENGRPNIGPFRCAGLVTQDSRSGALTYSGQYTAFAHFSKYVKRGARRITTSGTPNGVYHHETRSQNRLYHAAFQNPNGERVIILTNPDAKREIQVRDRGKYIRMALFPNSLTTLILND